MLTRFKLAFLAAIVGVAAFGGSVLATSTDSELAQVRRATAQFHSLEAAIDAGYTLGYVNGLGNLIITGCIAHPIDPVNVGAMGYHYFNKALIEDNEIDVLRPEGLVYERRLNGELKLVAVEYVVPGLDSKPSGPAVAPTPFGEDMVILVPQVGFHTLHAWIWSHNPAGMFAHWNPEVTCP